MEDLKRALSIESASRELIFTSNLNKCRYNWPVRQALGFREAKTGKRKARPIFFSEPVRKLYRSISKLVREKLQFTNQDELYTAWKEAHYQADIWDLLGKFGMQIWGEAMDVRRPQLNPESPLLIVGESDFYKTNLFYDLGNHRAYIALQLEHLMFVRAKVNLHNRQQNDLSTVNDDHSEKGEADTRIVAFRLPPDKLLTLDSESSLRQPAKRKHHSDAHEDLAYRPRDRQAVDSSDGDSEGENQPLYMRRNTQPQSTIPNILPSLPDISTVSKGTRCGYDDRQIHLGTAQRRHFETQHRPTSSPLSLPRETTPSQSRDAARDIGEQGQNEIPMGDQARMRRELRAMLLGELYSIAHPQPTGALDRWDKSAQLDQSLAALWKMEKEETIREQGKEQYSTLEGALEHWLECRRTIMTLGRAANAHYNENVPLPALTYDEWIGRLGSRDAVAQLELQLIGLQARVEATADTRGLAARLAAVLACVTKHPLGARNYEQSVADFNKKMFAWGADFQMLQHRR